jgi:hypothetical protein
MYGYLLNHLVDFHEIWYEGDAIQGDLDAIIFNPTASTILKGMRFKFQNQGTYFTNGSEIILN